MPPWAPTRRPPSAPPAAYCGLAGLKGTYGRVSIYGVIPYAWSFDHGPLARTSEDVALVMNAIAGYDPQDDGSANQPVPDFTARLDDGLRGLRLGVPREYFFDTLEPAVGEAVEVALGIPPRPGRQHPGGPLPQRGDGADTVHVRRPEAAVYQEEFLQNPDDYGADVRPSPEMGAVILAIDYLRAQRFRTAIRKELAGLLGDVDALVTPTSRATAHPIGRRWTELNGQPINPTLVSTGNTSPFSMTGSPALSVCCGFSADGLPIGMQIAGRAWDESTTLRIGAAYERATPWHERHPSL